MRLIKFLKSFSIEATLNYKEGDSVDLMVVSSLLNPYEEEINFKLYDEGVREIKLEQFEKFFIDNLKIEPFVLSLKFSGDMERVKRLLQLSNLNDVYLSKNF